MDTDRTTLLRNAALERFEAEALKLPKGSQISRADLLDEASSLLKTPPSDENVTLAIARLVDMEILRAVEPGTFARVTPQDPYLAALDRLSTVPGTCKVDGCGEMLLCCSITRWDGEGPMGVPRFGCSMHDVWLGDCLDGGDKDCKEYSGGLYTACLRDPSDAAWDWIAEKHRPALANAGLGVAGREFAYPSMQIGLHGGRTWALDRFNLIAVGAAEDFEDMLDKVTPEVSPVSARPKVKLDHTIPGSVLDKTLTSFNRVRYRPVTLTKAIAPGSNGSFTIGDTHVPARIAALVLDLHPTVAWFSAGPKAPVVGLVEDSVVALINPVKVAKKTKANAVPA